jgi:acyl dehydratase
MNQQIYKIRNRKRSLNYGLNKLRFMSPVPSGARIRLHQKIKGVESVKGGYQIAFDAHIEIEGVERPALVAEPLTLVFV